MRRIWPTEERPPRVEGGALCGLGHWAACWRRSRISVYDFRNGETAHSLFTRGQLCHCAAFEPQSERLFVGTGPNPEQASLLCWDLSSGEASQFFGHLSTSALAFHPLGPWLATGGGPGDGEVRLWSLPDMRCLAQWGRGGGGIAAMTWMGDRLAVSRQGPREELQLWDLVDLERPQRLWAVPHGPTDLAHEGNSLLALAGGQVLEFEPLTGRLARRYPSAWVRGGTQGWVALPRWAPEALFGAGMTRHGEQLLLWDGVLEGWTRKKRLWQREDRQSIDHLNCLPGGTLVAGASGCEVRLWNREGGLLWERELPTPIQRVSFDPYGRCLAAVGQGHLGYFRIATGELLHGGSCDLMGGKAGAEDFGHLMLHPEFRASFPAGMADLWTPLLPGEEGWALQYSGQWVCLDDGRQGPSYSGFSGGITALTSYPELDWVALQNESFVGVWEKRTGKLRYLREIWNDPAACAAFNRTGTRALVVRAGRLSYWNLEANGLICELPWDGEVVSSVAGWGPFYVGTRSGRLGLWEPPIEA